MHIRILVALLAATFVCVQSGCFSDNAPRSSKVEIWGKRGLGDNRFQKPRAVAIDGSDNLYVVDMTARIQVFDREGSFVRSWRTPAFTDGKPCGLSFSNDGLLMVADTHYYRLLFFTTDGELVEERTIGGENGRGPGQFGFVTDSVQDSRGNYYVAEYGDYDRIQKFDSEGNYLFEWGGHGSGEKEFLRPQGLAIDENDLIWVADSCNHRICIFDARGDSAKFVRSWGTMGTEVGKLRYPYDLFFAADGTVLIAEFGNNRVQKFTREGQSLGGWGGPGRMPGQLHQPWGLCENSGGKIHVLDSYNHRIQTFRWEDGPLVEPGNRMPGQPTSDEELLDEQLEESTL